MPRRASRASDPPRYLASASSAAVRSGPGIFPSAQIGALTAANANLTGNAEQRRHPPVRLPGGAVLRLESHSASKAQPSSVSRSMDAARDRSRMGQPCH